MDIRIIFVPVQFSILDKEYNVLVKLNDVGAGVDVCTIKGQRRCQPFSENYLSVILFVVLYHYDSRLLRWILFQSVIILTPTMPMSVSFLTLIIEISTRRRMLLFSRAVDTASPSQETHITVKIKEQTMRCSDYNCYGNVSI